MMPEDTIHKFQFYEKEFPNNYKTLCQKEFILTNGLNDISKLDNVGLPPREAFYSSLKQEGITENEYDHAQKVYNDLGCQSFKDYHMAYLKSDVLLLADVFENFRKVCMNYYKLDPANYLTAPSLAWDAMLMLTNVELELISDLKVLDIIERMKRGGLCFVGSKRHVKANNKYIEDFNPEKPSDYLMYWDANNLYGWAMSQSLPYTAPEFEQNVKLDDVLKTPDNSKIGYIVECDLSFPVELHDKFKEFPPCPENLLPELNNFSDYQKMVGEITGIIRKNERYSGTNKLVPHLMEHKNYVIHYRNLKFIKELGVEIGKVHNILSFQQSNWLGKYISFNTEKRKEAKMILRKIFLS
jgi:hypothetical protein